MRRLLFAALTLLLCPPALAQDRATLVADSVTVQSGSTLQATGHVEVFFKGQSLTAAAVIYDQTTNRLTVTGPIRIDDGKGTVFMAEQADLSADLSQGLLVSARLVLNQQLQLAAAQIQRSRGGTITALRSVAASSCTICQGNATPLWEIRAREVVHDATTRQIYFSGANLRFYGLPVLYLPVLRVPDPTLKRATGFLLPKLRSTSALGLGLKLPYFITMGASRDLTLTPYVTLHGDKTLDLRFRQAFRSGTLQLSAAFTDDNLGQGTPRGYVQATGAFDLGNRYQLSFKGVAVSDPAYLLDYGISDADRLENQIGVTRVLRDLGFAADLIGFQSLRAGESNSTLPTTVTDLVVEKRFDAPLVGGSMGAVFSTHSDYRSSTSPVDSNGDGVADGRDLGRISLGLDWNRNWALPGGVVVAAMTQLAADNYSISQDTAFNGNPQRSFAAAGVELRWPLVKSGQAGVTHLLEPVLQFVTAHQTSDAIPNGDSTLVEFDEGNLFALDRFPGADAVETGAHVNLGLTYRREAPQGWSLGATAGRVFRLDDPGVFSAASGLSGQQSDWLLAWSLQNAGGVSLTNRLVVDDTLSLTKGELRFDYAQGDMSLSGGYEYLLADASEARTETASEIKLTARHSLSRNWTADISGRYDIRAARLAQSGLELDFRNECIDLTLSLSRRYASSTSVQPSTDVGLSVELLGFGGGSAAGPSRTCRR